MRIGLTADSISIDWLLASGGQCGGLPSPCAPWQLAQCLSYTVLPRLIRRLLSVFGRVETAAADFDPSAMPFRYTAIARASSSVRYCRLLCTTSAIGP